MVKRCSNENVNKLYIMTVLFARVKHHIKMEFQTCWEGQTIHSKYEESLFGLLLFSYFLLFLNFAPLYICGLSFFPVCWCPLEQCPEHFAVWIKLILKEKSRIDFRRTLPFRMPTSKIWDFHIFEGCCSKGINVKASARFSFPIFISSFKELMLVSLLTSSNTILR